MEQEEVLLTFNDFKALHILNKVKFFLLIWEKGEFQKDIEKKLNFARTESLEKFVKYLKVTGFLSIDFINRTNEANPEAFYFISKFNFENIFSHICKSVQKDVNVHILNFLMEDRKNITPDLIKDMEIELNKNPSSIENYLKSYDKEKLLNLENSRGYFFLYLMNLSPSIKQHKGIQDFITAAMNHHINNTPNYFQFQTQYNLLNKMQTSDSKRVEKNYDLPKLINKNQLQNPQRVYNIFMIFFSQILLMVVMFSAVFISYQNKQFYINSTSIQTHGTNTLLTTALPNIFSYFLFLSFFGSFIFPLFLLSYYGTENLKSDDNLIELIYLILKVLALILIIGYVITAFMAVSWISSQAGIFS